MRGHGGSGPVAGDYTMSALAADVAAVLDALAIPRVHFIGLSIGGMLGQAFALEHGGKLASAMWCDTLPATPAGAPEVWQQRVDTVRGANSLAPLADPTIERWLTDAVKQQRPGRWKQIRDTIIGTTPAGYLGCVAAIRNFDFVARLPSLKLPVLVVCGAGRCRHAAGGEPPASPAWCPAGATRRSPTRGISPMSSIPTRSTASCWAG